MHRTTRIVFAGAFIAFAFEAPRSPVRPPLVAASLAQRSTGETSATTAQDIAALLGAARGVPPLICALAAQTVMGGGWGGWFNAPSSPVVSDVAIRVREIGRTELAAGEVRLLLDSLASSDPCVRELAVRMLGRQRNARDTVVLAGLLARLAAPQAELREVAALGLGFIQPASAVAPLVRALRDESAGVRANSAWALGHIEDGRALQPLLDLFRDQDARVREAAAVAVGRMDSVNAVEALMRVAREDANASVRRSAAWALGQLEARSAIEALMSILRQDSDARVREMAAWALGTIDSRTGVPGLLGTVRRDSSDAVRETAAWALGTLGDRSAVDLLGDIVHSDRSARVRATAAWALGQLDPRAAPRGLIDGLADADDDVRLKAAWALGQIGDSAAVPAIRTALRAEKHDRARKAEIRALLRSGGRSESELTELLSSSDPEVREAAVRGLAGNESFNPWPWPRPRPSP